MPNLRNFHKFMSQYVPFLVQQKAEEDRVKRYLEKSLTEYSAWGEQQKALQESGLNKEVALILMKMLAERFKDSDRPVVQMLEMLPETGIQKAYPELRLPTPTVGYEEAITPYQELGKGVLSSYGTMKYPEADVIENFIRLRGSKEANKFMDEIAKMQKEEAERKIREDELEEQRKRTRLGWEELGIRKKEVALEEKGEPKRSALETRLDSKRKERWGIMEKMLRYDVTSYQIKSYRAYIDSLNEDIKGIKEKLSKDKTWLDPDKRYADAAEVLKSGGYTKKDLFESDYVKGWLAENNLVIWLLLEYF